MNYTPIFIHEKLFHITTIRACIPISCVYVAYTPTDNRTAHSAIPDALLTDPFQYAEIYVNDTLTGRVYARTLDYEKQCLGISPQTESLAKYQTRCAHPPYRHVHQLRFDALDAVATTCTENNACATIRLHLHFTHNVTGYTYFSNEPIPYRHGKNNALYGDNINARASAVATAATAATLNLGKDEYLEYLDNLVVQSKNGVAEFEPLESYPDELVLYLKAADCTPAPDGIIRSVCFNDCICIDGTGERHDEWDAFIRPMSAHGYYTVSKKCTVHVSSDARPARNQLEICFTDDGVNTYEFEVIAVFRRKYSLAG